MPVFSPLSASNASCCCAGNTLRVIAGTNSGPHRKFSQYEHFLWALQYFAYAETAIAISSVSLARPSLFAANVFLYAFKLGLDLLPRKELFAGIKASGHVLSCTVLPTRQLLSCHLDTVRGEIINFKDKRFLHSFWLVFLAFSEALVCALREDSTLPWRSRVVCLLQAFLSSVCGVDRPVGSQGTEVWPEGEVRLERHHVLTTVALLQAFILGHSW